METEHRTFVVAIDGSTFSKDAFLEVWNNFLGETDRIYILHLFNPSKVDLPYQYKHEFIRQEYESYLLPILPHDRYLLCIEERARETKVSEQIQERAEGLRGSILVIGFHGLKGPKDNPTFMSSSVDRNLQFGRIPIFLVKKHRPREELGGGIHWCVLTDGSERSIKGLELSFSLMNRQNDRVTILYGYNTERHDLKGFFEQKLTEANVWGQFEEVECGVNLPQDIVQHINSWKTEFDIITLGVDGRGAGSIFKLGSVTLSVIAEAKVNILVYK